MPKTPKKTCLLIAGMHRSGTSALTRVMGKNSKGKNIEPRVIFPLRNSVEVD